MKLLLTAIDYKVENNIPYIYLFCRDTKKKRVIIKERYYPYFYIDISYEHIFKTYLSKLKKEYSVYTAPVRDNTGKNLLRIKTTHPKYVRKFRRWLHSKNIETYEADILFHLRYLIDKHLKTVLDYSNKKIAPLEDKLPIKRRILFLDIEILSPIVPDIRLCKYPIIIIGLYDSYNNEYYILHTANKDYNIDCVTYHYKTETRLLSQFIRLVRKLDPDIIVSFSPFDILYLINRMDRLGLDYKSLSSIYKVSLLENSRIRISGRQYLDYAELYRTVIGEQKWETLDAIGKRELGYGKYTLAKPIQKIWNVDPKEVLLYNKQDVRILKELEDKLSLIEGYIIEIVDCVGCNITDALYPSRIADILYLRLAKERNEVLPTRSPYRKISYKGAEVFDVKPGIYYNILVLDWKELYPSIIDSFNISIDTFSPNYIEGEVNIVENVSSSLNKEKKVFYRKEPIGWTPLILKQLRPLRRKKKLLVKEALEERDIQTYNIYKRQSEALKVVINAVYGLYGYAGDFTRKIPASRFYSPPIAESITTIGRTVQVEGLKNIVKQMGYNLIYGDTDSIFIELKTIDKSLIENIRDTLSNKVSKFIEDKWNVRSKLSLDIQNVYSTLILLTKKRYAGLTIDGREVIKGLEVIRKDQSEFTIEVQKEVLTMILHGKKKREILEYLKKKIKEAYTCDIKKISIPSILRKKVESYKSTSIHLQAFKYSTEVLGLDLTEGERFYWTYIKYIPIRYPNTIKSVDNKRTIKVKAIAFKDTIPKGFIIDRQLMVEKVLKNKMKDILSLINISWHGLEQKQLI